MPLSASVTAAVPALGLRHQPHGVGRDWSPDHPAEPACRTLANHKMWPKSPEHRLMPVTFHSFLSHIIKVDRCNRNVNEVQRADSSTVFMEHIPAPGVSRMS